MGVSQPSISEAAAIESLLESWIWEAGGGQKQNQTQSSWCTDGQVLPSSNFVSLETLSKSKGVFGGNFSIEQQISANISQEVLCHVVDSLPLIMSSSPWLSHLLLSC